MLVGKRFNHNQILTCHVTLVKDLIIIFITVLIAPAGAIGAESFNNAKGIARLAVRTTPVCRIPLTVHGPSRTLGPANTFPGKESP
jgi:hypothetical protein